MPGSAVKRRRKKRVSVTKKKSNDVFQDSSRAITLVLVFIFTIAVVSGVVYLMAS